MKKILVLASIVFAVGYTIAIAAQFAGVAAFNVFGLPALIGGVAASSVVVLVLSDYSRRPSFRVRSPRNGVAMAEAPTASALQDSPTMWTYTTRSA